MTEEKTKQKLKVSDLSEQEQKELIAEAYAVGLKGIFQTWNVETLKTKIKEAKEKDEKSESETAEQTGGEDEAQEKGEGETQENAEEPKAEEPKVEEPKKDKPKKEKEVKVCGICHICRSKVVDGVCTGCGFHK